MGVCMITINNLSGVPYRIRVGKLSQDPLYRLFLAKSTDEYWNRGLVDAEKADNTVEIGNPTETAGQLPVGTEDEIREQWQADVQERVLALPGCDIGKVDGVVRKEEKTCDSVQMELELLSGVGVGVHGFNIVNNGMNFFVEAIPILPDHENFRHYDEDWDTTRAVLEA